MMMCQAQRVEPIEKKKQNNVHHLLIDGIGMERVSARRRCDPSPSNNASGAWCIYKRTYIVTSANEWKHRASAWKHDDNGGSHRSSNTKKKRIENSAGHSFAATCATKSKVKNTHHPHTPPSIVFHYFIDNEQTKKKPESIESHCVCPRPSCVFVCLPDTFITNTLQHTNCYTPNEHRGQLTCINSVLAIHAHMPSASCVHIFSVFIFFFVFFQYFRLLFLLLLQIRARVTA